MKLKASPNWTPEERLLAIAQIAATSLGPQRRHSGAACLEVIFRVARERAEFLELNREQIEEHINLAT